MHGYSISPDGKTIAYAERGAGTGQDLWTLPIDLTGGVPRKTGEPQVFLRTPQDETSPAISPDGRWIAYVSNESGQNEVYVRPFPGGRETASGKRLASSGGGGRPEWSPNRHDLLYRNLNGQIMDASYTASGDAFSADKPRLWSSQVVMEYDIAPDGKSIAAILEPPAGAGGAAPAEAVFLLNFLDELRRRVPAGK
jgi:serine/threonine-protein kinase